MPPVVIDLTSSPEPDDTLCGAAVSTLQTFEPRKSKGQTYQRHRNNERGAQDVTFLGGLPHVPSDSHIRLQAFRKGQSNGQTGALSRALVASTAANPDHEQGRLSQIRKTNGQAHHHHAAQVAAQTARAHTSSARVAGSLPAAPQTGQYVPNGVQVRARQSLPSESSSGPSTERNELLWAFQTRTSNGDKRQAPEIRMVNGTAYVHTTTAPAPKTHAELQHSQAKLPNAAAPSVIVSETEIDHGKALKRRRVEITDEETSVSKENAGEIALSGDVKSQQSSSQSIAIRSTPAPSGPSQSKTQIPNGLESADHYANSATQQHEDLVKARSPASVQQRSLQTLSPAPVRQRNLQNSSPPHLSPKLSGSARSGKTWEPYTAEEDALLKKLKEVDNLSWEDIFASFGAVSYTHLTLPTIRLV